MGVQGGVTGGTAAGGAITGLNRLLRGELSAVETYGQALERLRDSAHKGDLDECMRSHEQRAEMLRQQVLRLGGVPSQGSGLWGGFARSVQGGARLLGERAAVATLEEGEDHGLRLYLDVISHVDPSTRAFVEQSLLSEQERTHRVMSARKDKPH